jgi:DNA-binding transcriptional LysR family regulator
MVGDAWAVNQSRSAASYSSRAYLRHTVGMAPTEPLSARDVATFVAAVETGSIQAAAEALVLTQSAATKRIQGLERRLGVALLERGRYGVRPTDAGRTLYPDAKEALTALERGEQRVLAAGEEAATRLRLAASHTVGGFLLPRWLSAFRAQAPEVHPQVEVVNSPGVLALVRAGDAEVGFVEGNDDLSGLERVRVGVDELVVVVRAGHRWARRSSVRPAELTGEPFYAREPGSGTRAIAEQRLAQSGTILEPSLQMASTESLKRAVLDDGFALLSRHAVASELASGSLVALPVRGVDLHRDLMAVRRAARRHARTADRLWRWLRESEAGA